MKTISPKNDSPNKNTIIPIENLLIKRKFKEAFDICLEELEKLSQRDHNPIYEINKAPFFVPKLKHECTE